MPELEVGAIEPTPAIPALSGAPSASARIHLGWTVFGVTTAACLSTLALDWHESRELRSFAFVLVAEALASLGVLLTTRMPHHRISWVIAAGGLWWGVSLLISAYAIEALGREGDLLPGGMAAAWFDSWGWLPGLSLFMCALLVLMPDGRLASIRWWPVPAAVATGTVVVAFVASTDTTFALTDDLEVSNPLALRGPVVAALAILGALLVIGGLAASLVAFSVRFRRSEGIERQQLRWVGLSLGVAVSLGVVGALTWDVLPGATLLPASSLIVLTAGITVAVLRYRLYELDVVVNRAAVYLVLTVAVVGSYVLVVGLVGSYLSRGGDLVVSLAVTGLVAIFIQPLRERVQLLVNRLMYGERDDPYSAIAGLGRTIASSLHADGVLPTVVETIGRTLALQYVGVSVAAQPEGGYEDVAAYGSPGDDVLGFRLIHQGAAVGELRLAARSGERLRERDLRLVSDLAPQVAAAVHEVELSRELQVARRRMVRLREEERRRIRRDLHDGLGPALAGLTFTLDAARNLSETDERRADELLVSATEQVQALIADVRRLIYGLRPPALDELGLVDSLGGLVSHESSGRTRIEIQAPDSLPQLEAAVEVAAYRIVQEALTNVTRHARASTCKVRVSVEPSFLALEVVDDGQGFGERRIGVGLLAMRERAAELGGTCEVASTPGAGTRVSVLLPRHEPDEASS